LSGHTLDKVRIRNRLAHRFDREPPTTEHHQRNDIVNPPVTQSETLVNRLPAVVLLVLLFVAALLFVHLGWSVILFPYPVDYGEGPLLDQAARLARGESVYDADLSSAPFTITNYPPLYPLAQAPLVKLFGPAFWYGRLLSWLAAVAAALCITSIVRTLTQAWRPALIGGMTFLALPFVSFWAPLARVDLLGLALSLGGLLIVIRGSERRASLLVAALLLTAAIYTRQTYALAAPTTAFVWLAWHSRRRAFGFAATVSALTAAVYLMLDLLTEGGFFFHVVSANVNTFSSARLLRLATEAGGMIPLILASAVLFLIVGAGGRNALWRFGAPYLVTSLIAALTIGKSGSNVNYWLEACAALSIATAGLVSWSHRRPTYRIAVLLLLAVQVSMLLGGNRYSRHLRWKLDQGPRMAALAEVVQRSEGPVLADEELGLLPLAGWPVELQPFELSELARRGKWDESPLLSALDLREFQLILMYRVPSPLHRTRWTPAMLKSIEREYERVGAIGPTVLFRPRRNADALPTALEPGS